MAAQDEQLLARGRIPNGGGVVRLARHDDPRAVAAERGSVRADREPFGDDGKFLAVCGVPDVGPWGVGHPIRGQHAPAIWAEEDRFIRTAIAELPLEDRSLLAGRRLAKSMPRLLGRQQPATIQAEA